MIFSVAESDSHSKMRVYAEFMNSFRDAATLDISYIHLIHTKQKWGIQ